MADDVFEVMRETAKRQAADDSFPKRMSDARRKMIFGGSGANADMAFWATMALKMKIIPDWSVPTLCTDGKDIIANPGYVQGLSDAELIGTVAHEVGHVALGHHARRQNRDPKKWNIADDLALNPILIDAGFTLPSGRLMPGEGPYKDIPKGLSAEAIYPRLPQGDGGEQGSEQQPGEEDKKGDDPGGCGAVSDPGDGSESACSQALAESQIMVAQAQNVAKMRGQLSEGLQRIIDEILNPKVDWREVLRDFITKTAKNDYRWSPPSRRFAWRKMYLPSIGGEALGEVVVAIDTSGSIGEKELSVFGAEIEGIVSAYEDAELTILYHDSDVAHVQTWRASDGPLKLEPKGGGGTDHRPVFRWVAERGMEPACMVCLTDLYSEFPKQAPGYPVLWASITEGKKGPWGRTVEVA